MSLTLASCQARPGYHARVSPRVCRPSCALHPSGMHNGSPAGSAGSGAAQWQDHAHQRRSVAARVRPGETADQVMERRLRESAQLEERVIPIQNRAQWQEYLNQAGDKLVVLTIQSHETCDTGSPEEVELHWKADKERAMEPCSALRHTFARTARECKDVIFLSLEADSDEGAELADELGVDVLPTLQFWKSGEKLWEHRGVVRLDTDLGEGVLYYGDTAANNEKASSYVTDLHSREDLRNFVHGQPEQVLTVVNVSLLSASPCVHVYPAVLALARNFVGYAAFSRLLGDNNPELLAELDIKEVPTFLFYRNGQEVGRHVGSSRGDLIGQILAQQTKMGIQPPPPPGSGNAERRPMRRGRVKLSR